METFHFKHQVTNKDVSFEWKPAPLNKLTIKLSFHYLKWEPVALKIKLS